MSGPITPMEFASFGVALLSLVVSGLSYRQSRGITRRAAAGDAEKALGRLHEFCVLVSGEDQPPHMAQDLEPYRRWDAARFDEMYDRVAVAFPSIASHLREMRDPLLVLNGLAADRGGRHVVFDARDSEAWTTAHARLKRAVLIYGGVFPDVVADPYGWRTARVRAGSAEA